MAFWRRKKDGEGGKGAPARIDLAKVSQ